MGLTVVTYEGSDNPAETVYFVGGSRLNKGVATAIPEEDVKALKDGDHDGHKFTVGKAAPKGAEHGSVIVDGEVRAAVRQPAVAAAEAEAPAEEEPEPTPTS